MHDDYLARVRKSFWLLVLTFVIWPAEKNNRQAGLVSVLLGDMRARFAYIRDCGFLPQHWGWKP
jgi:hypothetical protein